MKAIQGDKFVRELGAKERNVVVKGERGARGRCMMEGAGDRTFARINGEATPLAIP